jgi:hypothetical protein
MIVSGSYLSDNKFYLLLNAETSHCNVTANSKATMVSSIYVGRVTPYTTKKLRVSTLDSPALPRPSPLSQSSVDVLLYMQQVVSQ